MKAVCFTLLWFFLALPSHASSIPVGHCAVIVAARQTLDEAQSFIAENPRLSAVAIYRSQNGWFAISLGVFPRDRSKDYIRRIVSDLNAPKDSYCSSGRLFVSLEWSATAVQKSETKEQGPIAPNEPPQTTLDNTSTQSVVSSGSGFVVSKSGHVLTNAHVVESCRSISVGGHDASLVDTSESQDLALLRSGVASNTSVALFSMRPAKLNSDVTAVGYPYAGLLGGLNVTRGAVSSLRGLGGNFGTMQISAPIQSGNSGGPLLSASGEVVGVVVSKLDAAKISDAIGDLPQNVNFAIRGEIAKLFLAQNGVEPELGNADRRSPQRF